MNEEILTNATEEVAEEVIDQVIEKHVTGGELVKIGVIGGLTAVAVSKAIALVPKGISALKNKFFSKKDVTKEDFEVLNEEDAEEVSNE